MKLEIFADHNFLMALNSLMNQDGISMKTGYKLATIRETILAEFAKYEQMRKDLVTKFAEKDDLGNNKTHPDSDIAVFAGGNDKLFSEKIKELQQIEFELPLKLKFAEIESANLKPMEVARLKALIEA